MGDVLNLDDIFLTIWFETGTLEAAGFQGRSEIEDPLQEALEQAGIGEVTGGGGGVRGSNVDVEITHEKDFEVGLGLIRQILQSLDVPSSAVIIRHDPVETVYPVYESSSEQTNATSEEAR